MAEHRIRDKEWVEEAIFVALHRIGLERGEKEFPASHMQILAAMPKRELMPSASTIIRAAGALSEQGRLERIKPAGDTKNNLRRPFIYKLHESIPRKKLDELTFDLEGRAKTLPKTDQPVVRQEAAKVATATVPATGDPKQVIDNIFRRRDEALKEAVRLQAEVAQYDRVIQQIVATLEQPATAPRRRGRPLGSRNKNRGVRRIGGRTKTPVAV